jgi:phosphoglycerol transferase MdoB-like AlkP superfamily enzyme
MKSHKNSLGREVPSNASGGLAGRWRRAYPDNKYILHQEIRLLTQMAIVLCVYSLMRLLFLAYNLDMFAGSSGAGIAAALLKGVHFDAAILIWLNSPLLLFNLLPLPAGMAVSANYRRVHDGLFWLLNIPVFLVNIVDMEFFKFVGRRSTMDVLSLSRDLEQQWLQQVVHYWYLFALFLLFAWLTSRLVLHNSWRPGRFRIHLGLWAPLAVLVVVSLGMIVRGGLQAKPMNPADANQFENSVLAGLALNTPYTVLFTDTGAPLPTFNYYPSMSAAHHLLTADHRQHSLGPARVDNVVIIIVESLGLEFFSEPHGDGRGYVPFLEALSEDALFFENAFANGRDSANAVPSILGGLPHMFDQYYAASPFATNRLEGLGSILKGGGYNTHFFHGGGRGTMYFDVVSRALGVNHYYGKEDYPDQGDIAGSWGIGDEPYLQYVVAQLTQQPEPFFATVFTLSSHTPYVVPPPRDAQLAAGPHRIHKSVRYADLALRKFFESAKKTPWYDKTLFVITADHTPADHSNPLFSSTLGVFRVPIIFYHPEGRLPTGRSFRIVQQADILPSVLDYLGLLGTTTFDLLPFGKSVFDEGVEGEALLYTDRYFLVTRDGVASLHNGESRVEPLPQPFFRLAPDEKPAPRDQELIQRLQAIVQFYTEGMRNNSFYRDSVREDKPTGEQ